jgi:hypothetical protein
MSNSTIKSTTNRQVLHSSKKRYSKAVHAKHSGAINFYPETTYFNKKLIHVRFRPITTERDKLYTLTPPTTKKNSLTVVALLFVTATVLVLAYQATSNFSTNPELDFLIIANLIPLCSEPSTGAIVVELLNLRLI